MIIPTFIEKGEAACHKAIIPDRSSFSTGRHARGNPASRLNVVVDVGHHDGYSMPRGILPICARILQGLPVLFVGVHCPIDVIMQRRVDTWQVGYTADGMVPPPVRLWQQLVHVPGIYDVEVDTSLLTAAQCASLICQRLEAGPLPTAIQRIAALGTE